VHQEDVEGFAGLLFMQQDVLDELDFEDGSVGVRDGRFGDEDRLGGTIAAGGVDASVFMLIFVFPIFVTLGCVKRLTELSLASGDDRLPGRGYGRADRGDLLNMSALGMIGALVIFLAYSFSPQAAILYPTRWLLWVALLPIAAWLWRMIRLGYHGKQDYDPIVFALTDKRGIGLLLITLSLMFYAAGLWTVWLAALGL